MRQARSNFDRKRRREPSSSFIIIYLSLFTPLLSAKIKNKKGPKRHKKGVVNQLGLLKTNTKQTKNKRPSCVAGVRKDLIYV